MTIRNINPKKETSGVEALGPKLKKAKKKRHSLEAREKMSETRTRKMLDGSYNLGHGKGRYFSSKMNKEMIFRSSWEKRAFESLDKDQMVSSFDSEPFRLEYFFKQKRHYIPDIMITYIDGTQKLIEIKPLRFTGRYINKAKFAAGLKYCEERGIIFEVWTEKEIKKLL